MKSSDAINHHFLTSVFASPCTIRLGYSSAAPPFHTPPDDAVLGVHPVPAFSFQSSPPAPDAPS